MYWSAAGASQINNAQCTHPGVRYNEPTYVSLKVPITGGDLDAYLIQDPAGSQAFATMNGTLVG